MTGITPRPELPRVTLSLSMARYKPMPINGRGPTIARLIYYLCEILPRDLNNLRSK